MSTKNRHSLIVGGTRGLGFVLANLLAQKDNRVSVIGRRPPDSKRAWAKNISWWDTDLRDDVGVISVLNEIIRRKGQINNLIFCQRYRGKDDVWGGELQVSLTATKQIIEHLADSFAEEGGRSIIVVSSIAASFVVEEQPVSYHVVKAGLCQLARYYAVSLAEKGIRVNTVSPSLYLKQEALEMPTRNSGSSLSCKKNNPLERAGTACEIAEVIAFLCSSSASYISGQNIVIDGGISLKWHNPLTTDSAATATRSR